MNRKTKTGFAGKRAASPAVVVSFLLFFAFSPLLMADWRDDMWRKPVALREGVTIQAYNLAEPRTMKAYVVRLALDTPGIGFVATERLAKGWRAPLPLGVKSRRTGRECLAETRLESTADFMMRHRAAGKDVALAVNASAWEPFPAPKNEKRADPVGLCIADGEEVSGAEDDVPGAIFFVRRDGSAGMAATLGEAERADVAVAVSGFDIIMKDGEYVPPVNMTEGVHPRTAFGLTADGKTLVLLVVDGRQKGYSNGASVKDLYDLLRREGVSDAMNMDGGGSSSLVVFDGKRNRPWMLNRHAGGTVRNTAVNLGVVFAPPSGDATASAVPPLDMERTASVFHSYEFREVNDTPASAGYKPFYISHYGRHGSRRLTRTYVADVVAALKNAGEKGLLTARGAELRAAMDRIAEVHDGMIGQLTERGAVEHRMLARRMAARFAAVFAKNRRVRCQATVSPRVLTSQTNFISSLAECVQGIDFDFITGDKFQRHLDEGYFARIPYRAKIDATKRDHSAAAGDIARRISARFFAGDGAPKDAVKFANDLFKCASICQCLRSELDGFDIYGFFGRDEIALLSEILDADMYCEMANSEKYGDIALKAAVPLVREILSRADGAIADDRVAADLRFGHDSGLWPVAGLFRLAGPGDRADAREAARKCPGWKWMCMASNFQMVLYRDGKGGEILVKLLYNEMEMAVRGLEPVSGPYYRWSDVKSLVEREIAGLPE